MFAHLGNYLAAIACLGGFVLQFAVHRAPDITDSEIANMARKITIVALFVGAIYCAIGCPPSISALIVGLFGLGQMLYASHNLKLDKRLHLGTHT